MTAAVTAQAAEAVRIAVVASAKALVDKVLASATAMFNFEQAAQVTPVGFALAMDSDPDPDENNNRAETPALQSDRSLEYQLESDRNQTAMPVVEPLALENEQQ